ncbi:MAG: efflux RND transporter periplasmic adaptor subunit [Bacteroidetes bacterium]|nr:efflux RND transporter periplasmic adaptor subunit [Bacteroidota bacterium]
MNKFLKITMVLAIASCLILFNTSCGKKQEAKKEQRVEKVQTQTLKKELITRVIEYPTTLEGYEQMNVSPSITGIIEHIYVDVGSRVRAGQVLVRMDQNQLNTTKINLASTKTELNRIGTLKETGSASQQAYDQLKAQYDQLQQTLSFLENNTFVKAQFSGIISAKNYEDGEMYAGQPILTLTQIHQLKAFVSIPETFFPMVKPGMRVDIHSDIYPTQVFPSTIEQIYPTIDAGSHTFKAKLKIPNSREMIRPGMFVTTSLEMGKAETIVVPYQAVLKLQGSNERYIFLNNNGVAKRVTVELGQRFDENIEIISSEIKEGDEIIVAGQARLSDGVKIEVAKKKS